MKKKILLLFFAMVFSIPSLVSAHDGGHNGCFQNGCPSEHYYPPCSPWPICCGNSTSCLNLDPSYFCPWTDPACGSNPIDACDVRTSTTFSPGTYNLPNGVDVCTSGITLDCNEAVLVGILWSGSMGGISVESVDSGVIKNCNVNNYIAGIFLFSSSYNFITNNNLDSNWEGIRVEQSHYNMISTNTADSNHLGIWLLRGSSYNTVSSNVLQNSPSGGGIEVGGVFGASNNNIIDNNIARSNNGSGIMVVQSSFNTLSNNFVTGDKSVGIGLESSDNNQVYDNILNSNGAGVLLEDSNNNEISDNNISNSYIWSGIMLFTSSNNQILNNIANSNNYHGIRLDSSSNNNILTNNIASNNNYGIRLYSSSDNILTDNNVSLNKNTGIILYSSSGNTVSSNEVCLNNLTDFDVFSSFNNQGTNNTCDNPDGWNDDGIQGCSLLCTPTPVLLVHGYCSDPEDTWGESQGFDFYQNLNDTGRDVYLLDYAPGSCSWPYTSSGCANRDIRDYSRILKNRIQEVKQETNSPKVDVVVHSMGGLISRWYIQNSDYGNDVAQLIMLGTPNHGSQTSKFEWLNPDFLPNPFIGCAGTGIAADQMKPKSSFNSMLNYDIPRFNWTIWQSSNEVIGNVPYRNLAGTGKLTLLLKKVPKSFFERDGLDFTITTLGDSVVATYLLRLIHPDVGCDEYLGRDHFQVTNDQLIFDRVLNFLNNPSQIQQDLCTYEDNSFLGNTTIERQGFSPIIYDTIYPQDEHLHSIVIDSTINETLFGIIWGNESSELGFTLITPSGNVIDENHPGFIGNLSGRKYYRIQNVESGNWIVNITGDNVPSIGEGYRTRASFLSPVFLQVESLNNEYSFDPGSNFEIIAYVVFNDSLVPANMTAEIIAPDGSIDSIALFDDGLHNDLNASDGIYGNIYLSSVLGSYEIFVTAEGMIGSEQFARQFDMTNWVEVFPDLTLNSSDITLSNDFPFEGKEVTITANIHNIGNGDALNASIFFYDNDPLDGGELIGEDVTDILINQSSEVSVLWTVTAGNHSLTVFPSPYNSFLDLDYSNEKASRVIYVEPRKYRAVI